MRNSQNKGVILAIAGSDCCAGAGIQADIKTAAAFGVHAMSAVTSVVSENTMEVIGRQDIMPVLVASQISACFDEQLPAAIKIGMLPNASVMETVADLLDEHPEIPVVVDPVMIATSGGSLIDEGVLETMKTRIVAHATILTPNIFEAETLTGMKLTQERDYAAAAKAMLALGAEYVLIKGGHAAESRCVDRLYSADACVQVEGERLEGEFHGTGCSYSSALAACLARGMAPADALRCAHDWLAEVLAHPTGLGQGSALLDQASIRFDSGE